jgi:hypothetical protein
VVIEEAPVKWAAGWFSGPSVRIRPRPNAASPRAQ